MVFGTGHLKCLVLGPSGYGRFGFAVLRLPAKFTVENRDPRVSAEGLVSCVIAL